MNRALAIIILAVSSAPVYAHDYTWVLYVEGIAVASCMVSVYLIGKGNRVWWSALLLLVWTLVFGSIYITESLVPFSALSLALIVGQPIIAKIYDAKHRA